MKNRLLVTAIGASAMAMSGCAYQGSSYGHTAQPSYSYGANAGCGTTSTPRGCAANAGGTRFDLEIGAEQFVSGDIISSGSTFNGNPTLDVGYQDAFKTGYRVAAGLAKDISPSTTISAKGFYSQAEGEDNVAITTGAETASFSDYKSYGAELGLRKYVGYGGSQLRPYFGGTVGAAYVEDIIGTANVGVPAVLNEAGWVPTASGTAGFEMPFSQSGALALETGLRWTGKQDRDALLGVGEDSSRLSVPVTLRGTFRF